MRSDVLTSIKKKRKEEKKRTLATPLIHLKMEINIYKHME
jgi:hypothetical protein